MRLVGACASAVLVLGATPVVAGGSIASGAGNIQIIAPPASVFQGVTEHPTDVLAFDEQQGVTLASGLRTDIQSPGTYDQASDLTPTTLPAGTVLDSHLVHSDRSAGGTTLRQFTITFPTDILGVIITQGKLADSDVLGAPGTLYGGVNRALGFGINPQADIVILPDQRTIQGIFQTTTGVDHMRVVTEHNSAPTADAGGPYAGTEGTPVALTGTATDPDGDALSASWSATWTGDPGTACALAGSATLTPSVTCTDDALVTATLAVDDGVNPPVAATAQVTVGNVAPTLGALSVPAAPIPLGSPAALSASLADAGTSDSHTAIVAWGDTTSSAGTVTESSGAGTVSATHVYATPGIYTVSLTVEDDDLGTVTTTGQIAVNGPPAADAGGPYTGVEGLPTALVGTAIDPEGDALTIGWTFVPGAIDAGGSCTAVGSATLVPSLTCTDDAVVSTDLSADDGLNPPVVSSTTVTVGNEAPVLGSPAVTAGPIATGSPVSLLAPFTDGGVNDTHTATVDWGDLSSSAAAVSEAAGAGSLGASHAYAAPGLYTITITLEDDDLGTDTESTTVVVNSPPTADAGGPYVGLEGAVLALTGTASDPDGDALSISWSFAVAGGAGVVCTPSGAGSLTPSLTCNDDAMVTATLAVSDGVGPATVDTATITVGNAAPVTTAAVPSASPAPTGSTVSVGLTFSDDGTNDTHTASIDWGDSSTSPGTVSESSGAGTVSAAHVYTAPGTYTITIVVTDDDGAPSTETAVVVVNGAPTAGAGGPYSGVEGAPVTLSGTAADPDADVLTIAWTYSIVSADPGTACVLSGPSTLTPSLTCDDDALVDVTVSVADGVNPTVVDSASVDVANASPSVAAPSVVPNPAAVGTPVALTAAFTDPGVNDNHTATVDWGDSSSSPGTVSEVPGSGTVTGGHTYVTAGTYTVKVTVNDKDGGKNSAIATVVVNGAPVIDAGGPYQGGEGAPVALAGSASDPEGDPLSISWSFAVSTDLGGVCSATGASTLSPMVTCTDDATITATLTASDGVSAAVTDAAVIAITNLEPGIGSVSVPVSPVPVGTAITALATFTDAGTNDSHTASISWDDATSSAGTVTETAGSGSAVGSHAYTSAGTYTVSVTVTDDDAGTATATASSYVVVYDPSAGFVTGGGWITSPSGAYTPANSSDPDHTGKANYGFVSKYQSNASVPTGSTEFQLKSAGLNFHSTGYLWLVVEGDRTKAYYRGAGRVNNVSGYEFVVSVIDGRATGAADQVRIKVWQTSTGWVVYDNLHGSPDDASAQLGIAGGSIVIHG